MTTAAYFDEEFRVECRTCGEVVRVPDRAAAHQLVQQHLDDHDVATVVSALPVGEHGVDPDELHRLGEVPA